MDRGYQPWLMLERVTKPPVLCNERALSGPQVDLARRVCHINLQVFGILK